MVPVEMANARFSLFVDRGVRRLENPGERSAPDQKARVAMPVVVLASLALGVAGGVVGAVTTAYTLKEQVLSQGREEQRRELTFYVSREELASLRERHRDRLDAKLDELRVEVRALSVSVARIRRWGSLTAEAQW